MRSTGRTCSREFGIFDVSLSSSAAKLWPGEAGRWYLGRESQVHGQARLRTVCDAELEVICLVTADARSSFES